MKDEDNGIRVEVRPVARTRARGAAERRSRMALKTAVLILVAALVSVLGESWGLAHWPAEFLGAVAGVFAQQMVPPRLGARTLVAILVLAALLTAILARFKA